jgi:nucleoside-diphosphate-sugar epimerase
MKLAIFGATGRTGQLAVEKALDAGHEVFALARTPSKLVIQANQDGRLHVVQGNAEDPAAVERTIAGTDAVISLLAPNRAAMKHMVAAMKKHGVRRLVAVGGAGVPQPGDKPTAINNFISVLIKLISRRVYEEGVAYVQTVQASDRDWTVIRTPRLVDKPATGEFYVGPLSKEMGLVLSRADLADFVLREVENNSHVHSAPVVANK